MSDWGAQRRHERTCGYIVYSSGSPNIGTLCHGENGRDLILFGQPATLFTKRPLAQRAIRDSVASGRFRDGELRILRVAKLAETG